MKTDLARAYFDMARSFIDTKVFCDPTNVENEDTIFSLMSCTYVFSIMALTAFVTAQLHALWKPQDSTLRRKYSDCKTFEELMRRHLGELKDAVKELASQLGIDPLHDARPNAWQQLTELVKDKRDFFIHPNPEHFHDQVSETIKRPWDFPSQVVAKIMKYFFEATHNTIPPWLNQSQIKSRGFDYVRL